MEKVQKVNKETEAEVTERAEKGRSFVSGEEREELHWQRGNWMSCRL